MEVVAQWSGHLAYALRVSLRLTIEELADHVGMSSRAVAKWEADRELVPSLVTQRALDTVLERAPEPARARFAQLSEQSSARTPVRAPTLLDVAAPRLLVPSVGPVRASSDALDWFESSLAEQYAADNTLGPLVLLPAMTAHLSTLDQMVTNTDGAQLDRLLRVAAGYAEFTSWLSQDSGNGDGSAKWLGRALEWARTAGDARMESFVLFRRSVHSLGEGNARYAARVARSAQTGSSPVTARVRSLAAQTEAVAQATLGDVEAVERQLDVAAELVEVQRAIDPAGDPSAGGRYCELGLYLNISRAKCEVLLGRGEQAVTAWESVLTALPASYRRDRGQYLVRQASAYALAGLPEQACTAARESLTIARETGSTRTANDLAQFAVKAQRRWSDSPEVIALRDMLGDTSADERAS